MDFTCVQTVLTATGILGGVATFLALILAPMFYLGAKMDSFQSNIENKMDSLREEVKSDMNEFRKEMKDFHGRLCSLEERNRK